jgi:hypothetical protein
MNEFCSNKFDSKEVRSEYLREWLNLLCNTEKRYRKFMDNFFKASNLFHSACMYQKYLREEEGRGTDIKLDQIQYAIDNGDTKTLGVIFQELFIEPIDKEAVKYFVKLVQNEGLEVHDFISLKKNNRERSFWLTVKKAV